jgi:hypothetical protein
MPVSSRLMPTAHEVFLDRDLRDGIVFGDGYLGCFGFMLVDIFSAVAHIPLCRTLLSIHHSQSCGNRIGRTETQTLNHRNRYTGTNTIPVLQ